MKRIIILFNHFQIMDGETRSAIGVANALSKLPDVEVTLRPLYRFDQSLKKCLNPTIITRPVFKHYFKGFSTILSYFPMKVLHFFIVGNEYDIEIGFCKSVPIKIVAGGCSNKDHKNHVKATNYFAWMHGYDNGLTLYNEYKTIGKVICVSKADAQRLKNEAHGEFEVDYAYNVLDEKAICNLGNKKISIKRSQYTQFISVGRMSPEKGYDRLIKICYKLKKNGLKFDLWLVGDGPEKKKLENLVEKYRLGDVVQLLGEQANPHAYTSKSDVFICSSFKEGYSTACSEAIILGIPIITTDVSGGKEIIDSSECGDVVPVNDNMALYKSMEEVIIDKSIIVNWKKKLQQTKSKFSSKEREKKLFNVLGL